MLKSLYQKTSTLILGMALIFPTSLLAAPTTDDERIGYSLGVIVGRQLQQDVQDLDLDQFSAAIRDVYAGNSLKISDEEIAGVLQALQEQLMAQAQAEMLREAEENLQRGQAFLAENATQDGVQVTDSGLQYRVHTEGSGARPGEGDKVSVHYEGALIDGTVFDSSIARGEPLEINVNQVIQGWQEALMLMPEGSDWTVYIPADLAYGISGAGNAIGPNEALVFRVQLLDIIGE